MHVANKKPASAVDIKSDGELVYVVGPGSPGYVKTGDPCVVTPAMAYTVIVHLPISDASEKLLSWLRIGETRKEGFAPEPIDETHPDWSYRVELGAKAAREFAPSHADGEAGKRLFALCLRLVRGLELPTEKALELVEEHFNPRCTDVHGAHYPWDVDDILHKLEDARDRSDIPCGIPSKATTLGIQALAERLRPPSPSPSAAIKALAERVASAPEPYLPPAQTGDHALRPRRRSHRRDHRLPLVLAFRARALAREVELLRDVWRAGDRARGRRDGAGVISVRGTARCTRAFAELTLRASGPCRLVA